MKKKLTALTLALVLALSSCAAQNGEEPAQTEPLSGGDAADAQTAGDEAEAEETVLKDGVPDSLKMHKVKAFVMLKEGVPASEATKEELMDYARKYIAKYAMPYDIEFRKELPTTLVGKVAYRQLEEEELARQGQAKGDSA